MTSKSKLGRRKLAQSQRNSSAPFAFASDIIGDCGAYRGLAISTESDLIDYALTFAHGGTQRSEFPEWVRNTEGPTSVAQIVRHASASLSSSEVLERHKITMKTLCDALIRNDAERIAKIIDGVETLVPALEVGANLRRPNSLTVEFSPSVILKNVTDLVAYASILLLDASRPFRANLRRCEVETCGRFFLARRGRGRPGLKYHDANCMGKAHNLDSARRKRESRKGKGKLK